jgi:FtsZ-interacting cell division protein YlmF
VALDSQHIHHNDYQGRGKHLTMIPSTKSNARTHKVVRVEGAAFNAKRKEAADYFKDGNVVYVNLEKANKEVVEYVLNFLGGMAYALDGKLSKLSTNVYAMVPDGDEIGGDFYDDEYNSDYLGDNLF